MKTLNANLRRTFSLCVSLAALGFATPTLATNSAPIGNLDGRGQGPVNTAETLGSGGVSAGIAVESSMNTVTDDVMGVAVKDVADRHIYLERVNTATASFGVGIGSRFELDLNLRGVYEAMSQDDRAALYDDASDDGLQKQRRAGFGGVSGMLKTSLFSNDWIDVGNGLFVDSGAGWRGDYAVARSSEPTAGWLMMLTLGAKSPVELNVNGGWRYRDGAETVGQYRLRNEALYQGSLTFHATRWMGLWVGAQGRRLMIADRAAPSEFHAATGGDALAGMSFRFGDVAVSAFGGRNVKKESFGFGRRVGGLSISYVIGGSRDSGIAREISESVASDDISAAVPAVSRYEDEMSGRFDPMAELEKARAAGKTQRDDFDMIQARMAEERAQGTASIAFEDELAKYRAQEARADIQRAKQRAAIDREERAREARVSKQRAADQRRYEREAREAAAKLPSINDDDYNWSLDDH